MTQNEDSTAPENDPLSPTSLDTSEETAAPADDNVTNLTPPAADAAAEQLAALEAELAQSKDQTLRALAELENTRKRAAKEREDASAYGISRFARDLLNVSDNLRRALEAVPEDLKTVDDRLPGILTGIEATERELLKTFEQNGIQKIEPLDEKFDPNFHEVMFEAPMPDKANGIVIQVVEAGYVLKGRLLRAAKVGVAKNLQSAPGEQDDGHLLDEKA